MLYDDTHRNYSVSHNNQPCDIHLDGDNLVVSNKKTGKGVAAVAEVNAESGYDTLSLLLDLVAPKGDS